MFKPVINPTLPDMVFLYKKETQEYVAFRVHDAESMDHKQELQWKQQNQNYGVTQPNDHIFYLTFEEFNLRETPDNDPDLRQMAANLLSEASKYWHDHYLVMNG